jgi:hypothetical protein
MAFTNLEKTDMVLIYGETRGHLVKSFFEGYFPVKRIFVNVVQHLRDFGRFEMNNRDLGRQKKSWHFSCCRRTNPSRN